MPVFYVCWSGFLNLVTTPSNGAIWRPAIFSQESEYDVSRLSASVPAGTDVHGQLKCKSRPDRLSRKPSGPHRIRRFRRIKAHPMKFTKKINFFSKISIVSFSFLFIKHIAIRSLPSAEIHPTQYIEMIKSTNKDRARICAVPEEACIWHKGTTPAFKIYNSTSCLGLRDTLIPHLKQPTSYEK